jgi:hypothetical protein
VLTCVPNGPVQRRRHVMGTATGRDRILLDLSDQGDSGRGGGRWGRGSGGCRR